VRGLLEAQHPDLARLTLRASGHGWDNVLFRLGDDLLVRLPRRAASAPLVEHEQRWLPRLAPLLPLPIPVPIRVGRAAGRFPWSWSIVAWMAGDNAAVTPPTDFNAAASTLGAFVRALHVPAPRDAPANPYRGVPLADRADAFHDRVTRLEGRIDTSAVLALWDAASRAPRWTGPPLWIHGDLHPGNLVVADGRVSAVVDFGDLTAGDPATDLAVAWMLLPPPARRMFRASARHPHDAIDEDTWTRARGWALFFGLVFLAEGASEPSIRALGERTLDAVLES
jgi:aminoglycoside phosphotransferase (APT) family kinase protein